jgi:hypothetical protein
VTPLFNLCDGRDCCNVSCDATPQEEADPVDDRDTEYGPMLFLIDKIILYSRVQ